MTELQRSNEEFMIRRPRERKGRSLREESEEGHHQMEEALKIYEELQRANEELQQILRGQPVISNLETSQVP